MISRCEMGLDIWFEEGGFVGDNVPSGAAGDADFLTGFDLE